ncbi:WXG100 family type VII secretion target [Actinoallomurus rhizosphaericola]|uniref:WXG100 family type VII secretion target n=1 Tax=Actinoallomurus rhizosphaericola TaxID=2952536 RepID=UPI002093D355|nr:hypothetical protein [Actinoallomurus rhizosphaericola]MCO5996196.1 hypothetical protein [Actinoallomurus rhizosphaericola]
MDGFTAHSEAIGDAARGADALASRVQDIHRTTDAVAHSLSGSHPWGILRPVRSEFLSLAAEFQQHLGHMSGAIEGARERLHTMGAHYSATETMILQTLALAGRDHGSGQEVRRLNPASRFYRDHRTWNGVITALPPPFGAAGAAALDAWRFTGDLTSDDKYNIGTDIALLATDASSAFLEIRANYDFLLADPMGFLVRYGLGFLLNAFYWTKWVVDWLTGDPIAVGQAAYNFDSIAESCRGLAEDLGEALSRTLSGERGDAADAARTRLTALRDGIADTGNSADRIAALLQLVSSLIADVETILRGMISNLVAWAVYAWISAGLLAAESFGVSEVAAVRQITAESSRTASQVTSVLTLLKAFIRRIGELMARLRTELRHIKEKSFAKLLDSSVGAKFWNSPYGGGRQTMDYVKEDAVRGRHAKIGNFHIFVSTSKQAVRATQNGALNKFGFHLYRTTPTGERYPDGKRHIRMMSYQVSDGNGGVRSVRNPVGVVGASAATVLPIGRSVEYRLRAGHVPPGQVIDQNLDLWATEGDPQPPDPAT